ncbi:hypothetical protein BD779DRAFT_1754501 [Infundibulicybe gibba]|nr:hypothetical protein BD779DRAFT_1754501 [Infundibulicybe gibba]
MRRGSQASLRFQESLHTIPTPMRGKQPQRFDPLIMRWPVVIGTPISMILLGIALEIGVDLSVRQGGFSVPQKSVLHIVSTQFLWSFFPTIFVIPAAFMWRELDSMMRWYQPYVLLANGGARAEESLLLNYVGTDSAFAPSSLNNFENTDHHRYSLFSLSSFPYSHFHTESSVTNINDVGLAPDVASLDAFAASAGFAEAAVYHSLPDPPFVWGVGPLPNLLSFSTNPALNGSMAVNTTGIGTDVHCANPKDTPSIVMQGSNSSITSTSVDDCVHTVFFNISSSDQQYGVDDIPCGNASSNVSLRPVMFWFFNNRTDGNPPEARTVFCAPAIRAAYVTATADLNSGLLTNIISGDVPAPQRNLTSLAGLAFNGVIFPDDPNPFVQARANVIRSSVSGAIFRSASQEVKGLQPVFDLPNGLLDKTHQIYTQHLALSAQSIYFVQVNSTLPAIMTSLLPRLWIDPFPAHLLAAILCFIGFVGVFIHLANIRQRRKLTLTTPPGSIAAVVSLTSKSGFGDLLLPYDDEKTLERKLEGLQFHMDSRTGAIVADDMTGESEIGPEDAMTALLGKQHQLAHSSQLAFEAAGGYPPKLRSPLGTPYDP